MGETNISKTILITGCSTGIGRATAERLAKAGHTVYASARKLESIKELEAVGCKTVQLDVNDASSMQAAVDKIAAEAGGVGVLVNNAGYSISGAFETTSMESVRNQFETNVFGLVHLTQLVLPGMRKQGFGRIVNIGSMAGKVTFPGGAFYHATKYSLEAISDALRYEVAPFGISVSLIQPGAITTEFENTLLDNIEEVESDAYGHFNKSVGKVVTDAYNGPMRIFGGDADDVAKVIEKAVTARRPRPRYKVTIGAHATVAARKFTPDRLWDTAMKVAYPKPGATK